MNSIVQTVRADGLTLRPRLVKDLFLNREQIRVMTDADFFALFPSLVNYYRVSTGSPPDTIYVSREVLPSYGSEAWR